MEYFFAALRYLEKKLKGNAESKDRDLLNFLRRYGNGARFSSVKYKNEITEFYLFNYVYLCNKFGRVKMRRLYANVCIKNCNCFHRTLLPLLNHIRIRRYLTRTTHILATRRQISTWHCASYFASLLPSRCRYFGIKIRSILHRSSSTRIFSSSPSFDSNIFTSPYWITADGKRQTTTFRKLHWN